MSNTDVRKIRAGLKHPIIDADGHWAEFHPHMRQEFKRIGAIDEFLAGDGPMVVDPCISRNVISIPYRRLRFGIDA